MENVVRVAQKLRSCVFARSARLLRKARVSETALDAAKSLSKQGSLTNLCSNGPYRAQRSSHVTACRYVLYSSMNPWLCRCEGTYFKVPGSGYIVNDRVSFLWQLNLSSLTATQSGYGAFLTWTWSWYWATSQNAQPPRIKNQQSLTLHPKLLTLRVQVPK